MAIACLLLAGASAVAAPAYADDEFTLGDTITMSDYNAYPVDTTLGPDGNAWFTNHHDPSNYGLGRVTPAGQLSYFPQAFPAGFYPGEGLDGVTAGPDGNLWYVMQGTLDAPKMAIGRITPSGDVTMFTAGLTKVPAGITRGPDGNLWFTEKNGVGRITTAGQITEFNSPTDFPGGSTPRAIAAGPDGNLWFLDNNGVDVDFGGGSESIGRVTPAGVVTRFTVGLGPAPGLKGIIAAPDGAIWFTENHAKKLGRITTDGVITLFDLPADQNYPPGGLTKGLRASELYVGTTNGVVRVRFPGASAQVSAFPSARAALAPPSDSPPDIQTISAQVRADDVLVLTNPDGSLALSIYRKASVFYTLRIRPVVTGTTLPPKKKPLSDAEKLALRLEAQANFDRAMDRCGEDPRTVIPFAFLDARFWIAFPIWRECAEDAQAGLDEALAGIEPSDPKFLAVALPAPVKLLSGSRCRGNAGALKRAYRSRARALCRRFNAKTAAARREAAAAHTLLITSNRFFGAQDAGSAAGEALQRAATKVDLGELVAAIKARHAEARRVRAGARALRLDFSVSQEAVAAEYQRLLQLAGPYGQAATKAKALGFTDAEISQAVNQVASPTATTFLNRLAAPTPSLTALTAGYRSITLAEVSAIVAALKKQKAISSSLAKKLLKDLKAAGKGKTARKKNMRKFRDHAKKAKATPEKFLRTAAEPLTR